MASSIPTSELSHRVNANDHGPYVTVAAIFMVVASSLFIPIRLVIRRPWSKMLGHDDLFTLAATICSSIHATMLCLAVHHGLGRREQNLSPTELDSMNRAIYISNVFFVPSIASSQIAVAALTLRLSRSDTSTLTRLKKLVLANYVTVGLICAWAIAGIVAFALPLAHEAHTETQVTAWTILEIISFLLELVIIGIPTGLVCSLHMPVSKKLVVLSGFILRPLFHFLAIFRVLALHQAAESSDTSFSLAPSAVWVAIELNLAVTGATLPCLSSFLKMLNSGFLGTAATQAMPSGNSYNLKSASHLHGSRNRDAEGDGARQQRHWWDQQGADLRGDGADYKVHIDGRDGQDNVSTASFGSRQIMISKTVEARVDDISSEDSSK